MEKYLALGFVLLVLWHFKSEIKGLLIKAGVLKAPAAKVASSASIISSSPAPVDNSKKS